MSKQLLVESYLRGEVGRRLFVRRLVAMGVSVTAALAYAQIAPAPAGAANASPTLPQQACDHMAFQGRVGSQFCGG